MIHVSPVEEQGLPPFQPRDTTIDKECSMSIVEIREFLVAEGERRRRLGLLARRQLDDDWDLRSNPSESSEGELKAIEDD